MTLTKQKLSNVILYSNSNIEKMVKKVISESANAIAIALLEDKVILADKDSGKIYFSDYNFDGKKVVFENFEPVDIVNDETFSEAVADYFNDENYDSANLVEAYETSNDGSDAELVNAIVEGLANKEKDIPDYSQLIGINENVSIKNEPFFKNYVEYLKESPSDTAKVFDWVHPVAVSLLDEDTDVTFSIGTKEKAKNLIKTKEFKDNFKKAIKNLDEEMADFLKNNKSLLTLSEAELKELVGISVIGEKELMESRKDITSKILSIISEDEELSEAKSLINEEDEEEDEGKEKLATSEKDIDALKSALDKALESVTDEKLVKKIEDLKSALDASKEDDTTDVATVKECVELLSL